MRAYYASGFDFLEPERLLSTGQVFTCRTSEEILDVICRAYMPGDFVPCDVGVRDTDTADTDHPDTEDGRQIASTSCPEPTTRVLDPHQRVCEVAKLARPWTTADPYNHFFRTAVTPLLTDAGVAFRGLELEPTHQELLRYGIGGHFLAHSDRALSPTHLGTLLLVLPSADMEGGELVVETGPGLQILGADVQSPLVVYLPLGVVHSVRPVSAGTRYVAKAAVFGRMLAPDGIEQDQPYRPDQPRSD